MKTMLAREAKNAFGLMIDTRIAGGGGRVYQTACTDALCREIAAVRRKLLVEMAGDTAMYYP
jgi:type I restriction enzyme R subunit